MPYILQFILVFIAMTIADVCWTLYFISVDERKSVTAGIWGSAIYLCGAFGVLSYTEDKSLIIAAVLGSFVGTYFTVEYKKKKEQK
jgi:hypothetical protein